MPTIIPLLSAAELQLVGALLGPVSLVVAILVSALKGYVELLPFARPSSPLHDGTIRLVALLLAVGAVVGVAAGMGDLSAANALGWAMAGLFLGSTSIGTYHLVSGVTPPVVATVPDAISVPSGVEPLASE